MSCLSYCLMSLMIRATTTLKMLLMERPVSSELRSACANYTICKQFRI